MFISQKGETDKVSLGTTVKIKYVDDDEIEEYRIVGSKEADPSNNKISNESPIAKAIMNGKVGEIKKQHLLMENMKQKQLQFVRR